LTIDRNSVPAGRSPLKKEVKAMLQHEKERSSYLELENEKLQTGFEAEKRKTASPI
jgi:hypothetical protein